MHKTWSFPRGISSCGFLFCGFSHIYWKKNPLWKLHFLCTALYTYTGGIKWVIGQKSFNESLEWVSTVVLFVFRILSNIYHVFTKKIFDMFLDTSKTMDRRSRSQMFFKIGILKNFTKFTGKHLCRSFSFPLLFI